MSKAKPKSARVSTVVPEPPALDKTFITGDGVLDGPRHPPAQERIAAMPAGELSDEEVKAEQRAMGYSRDEALAKEGLAETLEAETPAQILQAISPRRVHATALFPHLKEKRDKTGRPLPPKRRVGGQFSVRRLVLINQFTNDERVHWVIPSLPVQQWGIMESERFSDPTQHAADTKYGNIEVVFDFQEDLMSFWRSHLRHAPPVIDPLYKNDWDSTKFPPDLRLPSPPGGFPQEAGDGQ